MTQFVCRRVLTLVLGVLAFACTGQVPAHSPTSPSATQQPPANPVTGPTLSGQVYEVTAEGPRAVSQGTVWYSVDGGRVHNGGRENIVNIDSSGRYTISALSTGSRIRLTAYSGAFQQTCAIYTVFGAGDTVQDIKVVPSGTLDGRCDGPMLSGVVFRVVDGERHPLKDQRVGFYSANRGPWDVYATTDTEGRFEFSGLQRGAGSLFAGDCSDAMDSKPIEIHGNANVDFDLTALIQSCPWYFIPQ